MYGLENVVIPECRLLKSVLKPPLLTAKTCNARFVWTVLRMDSYGNHTVRDSTVETNEFND